MANAAFLCDGSEMSVQFNIDDEAFRQSLASVIALRLGKGVDVEVRSIEVRDGDAEIRIVIAITSSTQPESIGKRFFGLTNKVRERLGSEWSDYFPVIIPEFSSTKAHA